MNLEKKSLLGSQNTRALALRGTLALEALVKGNCVAVITAEVIQVLDLVETNDPVLAGESLFQCVELGTFLGKSCATHTVHGLTGREQRLVVVIRHLVPVGGVSSGLDNQNMGFLHQAVLHGGSGLFVDTVLATRGEEVTLLHLVWPDTFGNTNHPEELVQIITRVAE